MAAANPDGTEAMAAANPDGTEAIPTVCLRDYGIMSKHYEVVSKKIVDGREAIKIRRARLGELEEEWETVNTELADVSQLVKNMTTAYKEYRAKLEGMRANLNKRGKADVKSAEGVKAVKDLLKFFPTCSFVPANDEIKKLMLEDEEISNHMAVRGGGETQQGGGGENQQGGGGGETQQGGGGGENQQNADAMAIEDQD